MSTNICPNCGEYIPGQRAEAPKPGAWRDPFGVLPPTEAANLQKFPVIRPENRAKNLKIVA